MTRALMFGGALLACALLLPAGKAAADEAKYLGAKKCKMCHIKQFKSWEKTKMAKAYDLLKAGVSAEAKKKAKLDPAKDYTKDKDCLACHVTGLGKPGGFTSIEETPHLAGVTCEACHGAGGNYLADDKMSNKNKNYKRADLVAAGLIAPPNKETCAVCHNDKSPFVEKGFVFDFEKRKAEGTHDHHPLKYKHD